MKLSPNVTDIAEIARACADAGADGLCLINTLLGMRIDLKTTAAPAWPTAPADCPAPRCSRWRCGWCGTCTRRCTCPSSAAAASSSAEDVCEMMLAGASAVEMRAANLRDPDRLQERSSKRLPGVCERLGVERIADLTGAAHG